MKYKIYVSYNAIPQLLTDKAFVEIANNRID